jgi:hypothetical protein
LLLLLLNKREQNRTKQNKREQKKQKRTNPQPDVVSLSLSPRQEANYERVPIEPRSGIPFSPRTSNSLPDNYNYIAIDLYIYFIQSYILLSPPVYVPLFVCSIFRTVSLAMLLLRILYLVALCAVIATAQSSDFASKNERSSAIKDALADSIRLRAEAHKEKTLAKYTPSASSTSVPPAAKTKSFAYTSIQVPGESATA